jgi:hypothetical protein
MLALFTRMTQPNSPTAPKINLTEGMTLRSLLGTSQPVKGTD